MTKHELIQQAKAIYTKTIINRDIAEVELNKARANWDKAKADWHKAKADLLETKQLPDDLSN